MYISPLSTPIHPQVAVKVEAVEHVVDPVEELTCDICDMTFEGGLEMEEHSSTHFKDLSKVGWTLVRWVGP